MLSPETLVGLLAEPTRRRVVATLILGSGSVEEVAARAGISRRDAVEALARLEHAGLAIVGSDRIWVILDEAFAIAARNRQPADPSTEHDEQPDGHKAVLNQCIRDGKIVHWPTKRTRRVVVLEYLAQSFEPGRRYSEAEVNAILRPFDDDVAMLRRWLYDESFIDRGDGLYWRSGGRVDG